MSTDRRRGSTLVELLVTVGVSAVVMLAATTFFTQQAKAMRGSGFRVEVQQALRGAIDAIARDIRLAGACLPTDGAPVALDGVDDEVNGDSITINAGLVRDDLTCVVAALAADTAAGGTAFTVDDASGFVVDKMALVWDGADGEFFRVTAAGGNIVRVDRPTASAYAAGSSLFALDQRQYFLDRSRNPPLLELTIDQGVPQPFAAGISQLDFVYVLARNCPACDEADLPASDDEWRLVNEVRMTATAGTVGGTLASDQVTLTQSGRAKPRNLLH